MSINKESILYGPVGDYFIDQGFFVISGAEKEEMHEIKGTSEFGVKLASKYEAIDVLALKWAESGDIHSVAIECKLYDTARESVGASIHQATDYQLFFDEVYVVTQTGDLEDKESVLKALGLGHLSVDLDSHAVNALLPAQFRNADRFNPALKAEQVVPRAVLPLVFKHIFGLPIRYMDTSRGGLWVAKDMVSNIQFNAGGHYDDKQTYFAINIQYIDDLRQIVRKVDRGKLISHLRALDDRYKIELGMNKLITGQRLSTLLEDYANRIDVEHLLNKIDIGTQKPTRGRRKSKPHLTVSKLLYDWDEQLSKEEFITRTIDAKEELEPLIEVFGDCF